MFHYMPLYHTLFNVYGHIGIISLWQKVASGGGAIQWVPQC